MKRRKKLGTFLACTLTGVMALGSLPISAMAADNYDVVVDDGGDYNVTINGTSEDATGKDGIYSVSREDDANDAQTETVQTEDIAEAANSESTPTAVPNVAASKKAPARAASSNSVYLSNLVANNKTKSVTLQNTRILQQALDQVSDNGGGTVSIPAGTFYFKAPMANKGFVQNYIIKLRSHVHLQGAGQNQTILKQYGDENHSNGVSDKATAMFYRNNYRETNGADKTPLEDADFSDFTINGDEYHYTEKYNTGGQTFGIKIYKDCDFRNVTVLNSPATGFGCDSPINSTFTNCYAENCGKQATSASQGASGFGIGTGVFDNESLTITNCRAVDCTKYGFFFEHQGVFNDNKPNLFPATGGNFVVQNCSARGNRYDFGARRGNNVKFISCTSEKPQSRAEISRNSAAFFTEQHSKNVSFTNCTMQKTYSDVVNSYKDAVRWALQNGIADPDNSTRFAPGRRLTRGDAILMVYKMVHQPGTICTTKTVPQTTPFVDVRSDQDYYDAVEWGIGNGVVVGTSGTTFTPGSQCDRKDLVTFLWRLAGKPDVSVTLNNKGKINEIPFTDVPGGAYYTKAIVWAYQNGIAMGTTKTRFSPRSKLSKVQSVLFLYRYANKFM